MDFRNINFNKLNYANPIKFSDFHLSKYIYNDDEDQSSFVIKTPTLRCNKYKKIYDTIFLEFELTSKEKSFYEFLIELDDKNITTIFEFSELWFNKQLPFDIVDDYHHSIIRMRKRTPVIKLSIKIVDLKKITRKFSKAEHFVNKYFELKMKYNGIKFLKQAFYSLWEINNIELKNLSQSNFEFNKIGGDDIFTIYNQVPTPRSRKNVKFSENEDVVITRTEPEAEKQQKVEEKSVEEDVKEEFDDGENDEENDEEVDEEVDEQSIEQLIEQLTVNEDSSQQVNEVNEVNKPKQKNAKQSTTLLKPQTPPQQQERSRGGRLGQTQSSERSSSRTPQKKKKRIKYSNRTKIW